MDTGQLTTLIDQYRSGLEAEITILLRLKPIATAQREASTAHDIDALNRASDERDRLMASLVTLESELKDIRRTLAEHKNQTKNLPGQEDAAELHRQAIALVSEILKTDSESAEALAKAEIARRDAARAVEQGETTLSAYRRVMTAPAGGAALVDRRG